MKNQANMTLPKVTNKAPVTDTKEMEIYGLPYKEFKIITLQKLKELQENTVTKNLENNAWKN